MVTLESRPVGSTRTSVGWRELAALKMRLNLNCPLAFVPGYLVLNWMETEDPSTDTTSMDGSEGEPGKGEGEGRKMMMNTVKQPNKTAIKKDSI